MKMRDECTLLKNYLYRFRWLHVLQALIILSVYSSWLTNPDLHIDPDAFIMEPGCYWGTYAGRPCVLLTNILFGMEWYNPIFESVTGWLLTVFASIVIGYLFYRAGSKNCFVPLLFVLVFLSPILMEHNYYSQRIFQNALAFLLCGASVGLSYATLMFKNKLYALAAIACSTYAFGIHQSFVSVYITLSVLVFIFLINDAIENNKDQICGCAFLKVCIQQLLFFLVSFVIYYSITYTFFYTELIVEKSPWLENTLSHCLSRIIENVKDGCIGLSVYKTWLFGAVSVFAVLTAIYEAHRKKQKPGRWLYFLAVLGFQLCAFLPAIMLGDVPGPHTELSYPLTLAGNLAFLLNNWSGARKRFPYQKLIVVILILLVFWTEAQTTMRFLYTDRVRIEEDKRMANEIAFRIDEISGANNKRLLFIGSHANNLNPACLRGNYIGRTIFGWDRGFEPRYVKGSARTCRFFNTLGIRCESIEDESAALAVRKKALLLPAWPEPGSVVAIGDYIVVKLCEDEWPEDFLDPDCTACELRDIAIVSDQYVRIDYAEVIDGKLLIKGWTDYKGASEMQPSVLLMDIYSGSCYKIATCKQGRDLLYIDGKPFYNNGFVATVDVSDLPKSLENYKVLFANEDSTGRMTQVTTNLDMSGVELLANNMARLPSVEERSITYLPICGNFSFSGAAVNADGQVQLCGEADDSCLFGPYSPTDEGVFNVVVKYKILSFKEGSRVQFDVAVDQESIAHMDLDPEGEFAVLRDVQMQPGHTFETRVFASKEVIIVLESIQYSRAI